MKLPVLYSFRRCPYAIRARMALAYAEISLEHREVLLRDKPDAMLAASPKGTVPVLVLEDGEVLDESIDVMHWAVSQRDPSGWWRQDREDEINSLIADNDGDFKHNLDRYKYWDRYPEHAQDVYRDRAGGFLDKLENQLQSREFLVDDQPGFADVAVFPFIRQFAFVDKAWFDQSPYARLQAWLQHFLQSSLFQQVMPKLPPWRNGDDPLVINPGSGRPTSKTG